MSISVFPKDLSLRKYAAPLISGGMLVLCFPTLNLFPLAWVAFVPFMLDLYGRPWRDAFRRGLLFGLIYFFGTVYWIYHSMHWYGSIPFLLCMILVLLLSLYLALYPAVFAALFAIYLRKTDLPALVIAPFLWTSLELARSYALSGFPWSSIGYSQYLFLPFIQMADLTGVYGISFIVLAFNGAIADAVLLKRRRNERPLFSLAPTVSAAILLIIGLVATFAYGFYRLGQSRPGSTLRVAIVQGNIEQAQKWDRAYQRSAIKTYQDASRMVARESPDLIIWPESALPFVFGRDMQETREFLLFQRQLNTYLLTGTILPKYEGARNPLQPPAGAEPPLPPLVGYTNSSILLDRDGNVTYRYDKIHLVPFGEYVPLKNLLFFVDKLAFGIGDYIPGNSYIRATSPIGSFGTPICYEIIFPGLVRKLYAHGGDLIVTITNDAWFGKTTGPYQHFSMAVFRAIENRKPVVRAANTGISGFIDSNGRVGATTPLFERTTLVSSVTTDKSLTIYTKYGDIFSYFCIVGSLLLILSRTR